MIAGKLFLAGLTACTLALVSACSIFESDEDEAKDPFYRDPTLVQTKNPQTGHVNLKTPGESEINGPGKFGETHALQGGYDDTFGPRIPGVNLETIYFGFDASNISAAELPKVYAAADFLLAHPEAGVVIEGNCDDRGSEEYNRALGEKRAIAAKEIFIERGIDAARIKVISYGEERPAVQGENEDAWSQNRRDDLVPVYLKK